MPSRFRSTVDLDAMRRCIETLVQRHACLRTVFDESNSDSRPLQRVLDECPPEFRVVDAAGKSDRELLRLVETEVTRPFELTTGPLLRFAAFRVAEDDCVMVATTHHIAVDFWSLVILMNEVRALYPSFVGEKIAPDLADAPENYAAFVQRQSNLVLSPRGDELRDHWRNRLRSVRPVLQWPTDFDRPTRFTHRAATETFTFDADSAARVAEAAKRWNVTGNVVLMAALQVFVARWTGQDSFSIGTPFSGRNEKSFEKTVGFFVNVLPIGADLTDNPSFEQLVRAVGASMVDALVHEELPFSEIVRACAPGRDASRHPLFQVSCTFEKAQVESEQGRAGFLFGSVESFEDFAGMRQESFLVPHPTCHYDVEFVFELGASAVHGMICYCRDLFAKETAASMATQFPNLLNSLLDQPQDAVKQIPWRIDPVSDRDPSVPATIDAPSTVIDLIDGSKSEIVAEAKRYASRLRDAAVDSGEFIPVCLPKGRIAWSAILGTMMAGCTPIPVDADQPCVGLQTLIEDAEVKTIIAAPIHPWHEGQAVTVVTPETVVPSVDGRRSVSSSDLAYVVYTSGSTGKPKGVMIQHAAITNTIRWRARQVRLSPKDRVVVLLSHQFDAAMAIVLSSLNQGAELVWLDQAPLDLDALLDRLIDERITILPAIPNLMRAIANHPRFIECTSIRHIWCGGESMPPELVPLVRSKLNCEIWNFYGPTEAAVEATAHRVDDAPLKRPIPIGKPIDGAEVHVLDDSRAQVPVGMPGQLVIGGDGLSTGYLNRPHETDRAFVELEGRRVYLTGDRAKQRADGSFEFLGRLDHQVKMRGFRIELEEIERTIERHRSVRRAAAKVVHTGSSNESLAAYVTVESDFSKEDLTRHLSSLPAFKRPGSITVLKEMPIGVSGKVLRDQLPIPTCDSGSDRGHTEPATRLELFLAQEFCSTLDQPSIGTEENFFETGGTSLQAAMLTSRLSSELGVSVPTSLVFDLGDVGSIAARLSQLHEAEIRKRFGDDSIVRSGVDTQSLLAALKPSGSRLPLFMVHPPGGIVVCYRELADQLPPEQPLYAVRSRGLHGDETLPPTLGAMAEEYARAIRDHQPGGPYLLGGWSLGGVIAYEVARQLISSGDEVAGLVLLDSTVPEKSDPGAVSAGQEYGIELSLRQLGSLTQEQQLPFLYEHAEKLGVLNDQAPRETVEQVIEDLRRLFAHHLALCEDYELEKLDVDVLLIRPREVPGTSDERPDRGWGRWVRSVKVADVAGHHHSMVQMPGVAELANHLQEFALAGRRR
ncbi:MAG: amino acid adenylation domain-containing protein [Planctomycetota bacterium]